MPKMKPKVVFIDTEQFDHSKLSFDNSNTARLADLVKTGQAKVLLTDVVTGEVRRHIRRQIKDARKKLGQQFGGLLSNLKKTPRPAALDDGYWAQAEKEVMEEFAACCKRLKAEVLPLKPDCVQTVFDWYFSYDAPFDVEKRKSEFPDAFSIATVDLWAKSHHQPVYVVSNDAAFSVACAKGGTNGLLTHKKSLAEFFALYPDATLAAQIKQAFVDFLDAEENSQFGEDEFRKFDFYVADFEHMQVESVLVLWTDPKWLHVVEAANGRAVLAGDAYVTFLAEIDGIRKELEKSCFVSAEIVLEYAQDDPTQIKVRSVKYENDRAIEVTLPSSYYHEG